MALDIQTDIAETRKRYQESPRTTAFNALVLGPSGTGKTFLLRTCRFPVHVDVFDPGGEKSLRHFINTGDILADTAWSYDDPLKPTVYAAWVKKFQERVQSGYFNHFGTYCIDSSTMWAEAIMNEVLRLRGKAGTKPDFTQDYGNMMREMNRMISHALALPCDFILTGHLKTVEDKVTGRIKYEYLTNGRNTTLIPLRFDEIYITEPKETSQGLKYQLITSANGTYTARSRLAEDGKIAPYEEANIKKILSKAGYPTEDKPHL